MFKLSLVIYSCLISSSSRGKAFHEAQVVFAGCLSLRLPLAAVFSCKAFLFVCHPRTQAACLLVGPLLTTPAPPRISGASSVPDTAPNVCVVFLILLSFYFGVHILCMCIHAYSHAHIWPHATNRYSFVVGPSPQRLRDLHSLGLFSSQASKGTTCA